MNKKTKNQKKVSSFNEEDAASLIEKYEANTVLTLLHEVANYPHSKFDWNVMVKKTSTGISNAREYQMLWRHLAYGHALMEQNFEDDVQPLDDDSDLECEWEETELEAAACVKVMIESPGMSESPPTTSVIQAPLTINVPVCGSSRIHDGSSEPSSSMQSRNIIFPVNVQRHTRSSASSTRYIESKVSTSGNTPVEKKRKTWTEEEDMQLQVAVQRWGEGNWADMAGRHEFPLEKSPSQLAERWSMLRKQGDSTN